MTEEQKQALIAKCKDRIAFHKAAGNTGTFDADTLKIAQVALAALTEQPAISDDTERMNWLVSKTVEVRQPLRYGSRHIFWSEAVTDEEDDHHATLLREQIDAAISNEVQE